MLHTLTKIKNLVSPKEVAQPNTIGNSKRFKLEPISFQWDIPKHKIAERAFMIWQERGCSHGNDFEDWLLAKIQLEDELN
jgi:hypothetical protein